MPIEESGRKALPHNIAVVRELTEIEESRLHAHREADRQATSEIYEFADTAAQEANLDESERAAYARKIAILNSFLPEILVEVRQLDYLPEESKAQTQIGVKNLPGIHINDFLGAMSIAASGWGVSIAAISTERIPVLVKPGQPEEVAIGLYREAAADAYERVYGER